MGEDSCTAGTGKEEERHGKHPAEELRCSDTIAGKENSSVSSREAAQEPALGDTGELHPQGAATAQLGCSRFSVAEDSGSQV